MVASTDSFPVSNQSDVTADDIVIADRFEAMVFDNCSEEDILAETMFTEVRVAGIIMLTIATILTVLMVVLYLEAIRFMQENIPAHRRRTRLTWLLGAYPVSSVLSLIGLYIPGTSTILNLSISLYLAIAYYQFCLLIADYYGGYHTMVAKLKHANISLAAPPLCCCCRCLPSYRATEANLRRLKIAILQVCIVLPIALFVASVIWIQNFYSPGVVPINFIYTAIYCFTTVSTLCSLYGLMMFFIVSKDPLRDYDITPKFLTISLVLAVFNTQNFILGLLSSMIVFRCIGETENGRWKIEMGVVDLGNVQSVEELLMALIQKSSVVEVFFSGIGHYLLIFEMCCIFFWARNLYRTRKCNIETLLVTEDSEPSKYRSFGDESDCDDLHELVGERKLD